MADSQPAVKDAPVVAATDTAPAAVETSQAPENLDNFNLSEEDSKAVNDAFKDGAADGDEGLDSPDDPDEAPAEPSKESEPDTPETPEEAPKTDEQPTKADERKQQLNTEIRDLVQQRNQLRQQVEEINGKTYEARTPEQLQTEVNPQTGENYTAIEARLQAMEETQSLERYNNQVAEAQLVVNNDAEKVLREMPMFRKFEDGTITRDAEGNVTGEPNPLYQSAIAEQASELLDQNYIRDENTGQVIGTHLPIYQLYKLINDAAQLGTTNGEIKGQKNAKKTAARVDSVSSNGPKGEAKDKFMAAFDREFGD